MRPPKRQARKSRRASRKIANEGADAENGDQVEKKSAPRHMSLAEKCLGRFIYEAAEWRQFVDGTVLKSRDPAEWTMNLREAKKRMPHYLVETSSAAKATSFTKLYMQHQDIRFPEPTDGVVTMFMVATASLGFTYEGLGKIHAAALTLTHEASELPKEEGPVARAAAGEYLGKEEAQAAPLRAALWEQLHELGKDQRVEVDPSSSEQSGTIG